MFSKRYKGQGESFPYEALGHFHFSGDDKIGAQYQREQKGRIATIEHISPDEFLDRVPRYSTWDLKEDRE